MRPTRLRRLPGFSYTGPNRYSLTICAYERRALFENRKLADCVRTHILRAASELGYTVIAYCIMPDHVHILTEGQESSKPLPEFVKCAKQASGFHGRKIIRAPVWQTGYFERVLRETEDTRPVVAYILENPVRRGLVTDPRDYPLSGSGVHAISELLDYVQITGDR
ncbi:MAG TPA: transposase [Vicinamibacterales bacterium]|nr:transposase [Vicinamibacterales bacterium]